MSAENIRTSKRLGTPEALQTLNPTLSNKTREPQKSPNAGVLIMRILCWGLLTIIFVLTPPILIIFGPLYYPSGPKPRAPKNRNVCSGSGNPAGPAAGWAPGIRV